MMTVTQLDSTSILSLNTNVLNKNSILNASPQNVNASPSVAESANLIQNHLNVLAKQQQQQQQQEQHHQQEEEPKAYVHSALTRAISHPHQKSAAHVVSLVNTLLENCHLKLEITQSGPLPQVNTSRYKTELCRPFEEAGECKYGEKCQFAHGYHELRNLRRHPKYKTEYCRTFHSIGFCPYGPRCHFVHNADEALAMIQHHHQQQNRQQQIQHHNHINASFPCLPQNSTNHPLPLSPLLSMSTGSDRLSLTGSLSLSPTNSTGSFPFVDHINPANSIFPTAFPYIHTSYSHSPGASPNSQMSPINTPPPSIIISGSDSASSEEARLPVFNRLSSILDAVSNLAP